MDRSNTYKKPAKLLAIETATFEVAAAVVSGDDLLGSLSHQTGQRHVEELFPMIDELLETTGCPASELDGIVVDIGPGLFTGLRVGIAAAKVMAYGLSKVVIPITGTVVLAEALKQKIFADHQAMLADVSQTVLIITVLDVRRGEVAFEMSSSVLHNSTIQNDRSEYIDTSFTNNGDCITDQEDFLKRELATGNLQIATPELFSQYLKKITGQIISYQNNVVSRDKDTKSYSKNWKVVVGGSGIVRYRDVIERDFKETSDFVRDHLIICDEPNVPPVDVLAQLGHKSFIRGDYVQPSLVKPIYLREADAKAGAWKGAAAKP